MAVIGYDAARNRYLLDGYYHKMGLAERWQKMNALRRKWLAAPGVQNVYVGYERFGMADAIEYFEECMQRQGDHFDIVELAWPSDGPPAKFDRIQRLEPAFRNGRMYLIALNLDDKGKPYETANQRKVRELGQEWRVLTPVKAVDHNGQLYPLNKELLSEYLVYPFSKHDDFLDALSRFDDMDPHPPILIDERSLEPEVFADGT
jgi:hypothetical protein